MPQSRGPNLCCSLIGHDRSEYADILFDKRRNMCDEIFGMFFVFQVFVYTPQVYSRIKERLKTQGVAELSAHELSNYFSPWYAEHMGFIQSASGNRSVEAWAVQRLRVQYYIFTYASLLKLHGDTALLKQLDSLLGDEALLQLQLRTLAPAFKDPKRRQWFLEVIDNYFKLWEVNMWWRNVSVVGGLKFRISCLMSSNDEYVYQCDENVSDVDHFDVVWGSMVSLGMIATI